MSQENEYIDDREVTLGDLKRLKDYMICLILIQISAVFVVGAYVVEVSLYAGIFIVGALALLSISWALLTDGYVRRGVGLAFDMGVEPLDKREFGEGSQANPRGDD